MRDVERGEAVAGGGPPGRGHGPANGGGSSRLVLMRQGTSVTATPVDDYLTASTSETVAAASDWENVTPGSTTIAPRERWLFSMILHR